MKRITALALIAATGVLIGARASAVTEWSAQDYDLYSGDFNGDGRSDILFVAKDAGKSSGIAVSDDGGLDTVWQSWSSTYLGIQWSGGAHIPVVGDFNGDDKSDVLLQRAAPGNSYLLLADVNGRLTGVSQTIAPSHLGLAWSRDQHTLLGGDFSGDNRADLFMQAADPSGVNAVPLAGGGGLFTSTPAQTFTDSSWPAFEWSRRDSVLTVGDFNGDGRCDLLIQSKPNFVMIDYEIPIPVPVYAPNFFGIVYSQGGATPFQQAGVQQWSRQSNGVDWSPSNATAIVGDFNDDGRDDVLLQARTPGSASYLLLGNASGAAFGAPTAVTANVSIASGNARLVAGRFGGAGAGLYVQARTASGVNYIATAVGATTSAVAHDPAAMLGPVETLTYSYDARGRLKTVARIGGVNDSVRSDYTYDKANNRKTVVTTGSSNPPP